MSCTSSPGRYVLTCQLDAQEAAAYFLSSDPSIMQDVQRAMKLKARREARLKGSISSSTSGPRTGPAAFPASARYQPRIGVAPPIQSSYRGRSVSGPSTTGIELDFSPSTRQATEHLSLHPVPTIADDGLTLDWSGSNDNEKGDKRWSISVPKRKGKDRAPIPGAAILAQQDKVHTSTIQRHLLSAVRSTLTLCFIIR